MKTKKSLIVCLFVVLALAVSTLALVSCNLGSDEKCSHTYGKEVEKTAATCESAGVKEQTCTKCKYVKETAIAALGHDYGDWVVVTPATTESEGKRQRVCSRDASHIETETIQKLTPPHR